MGADEADPAVGPGPGEAQTPGPPPTPWRRDIKKIGDYDLIFAGRQAIDGDTAQVGPQIAEKLGLPQVTYVKEFQLEEEAVIVKRALEDGYEKLKLKLPCVLTAIKELNTPRYMSVPGIRKAGQDPGQGLERPGHRSGPERGGAERPPRPTCSVPSRPSPKEPAWPWTGTRPGSWRRTCLRN